MDNKPAIAPPPVSDFQRFMAMGKAYSAQSQYNKAIENFRQALNANPQSVAALHLLSDALFGEYSRTNKNSFLEQALDVASAAVKLAPENADLHQQMSIALMMLKRHKEAMEHIQKAIQLAPAKPGYQVTLGALYLKIGQKEKAVACYEKALAANPHDVSALVHLASHLYHGEGKTKEAYEYAHRLLKISPESVKGLVLMGHLLLDQGKIAEAIEHAQLAISRSADNYHALFLICAIETRRHPFRGFGYRLVTWSKKKWHRILMYAFIILFFCLPLGLWLLAHHITLLFGVGPIVWFDKYLRRCMRNMRIHVEKVYLAPQKLKDGF